ncbi:hypothetical protein Q0590_37025 [Rhodocytophaga aerolata]|uniref:Uncharacterized protein n=1 Tax=Rhodocytophaga aerolata TaxID=455078 RepID=A0ABT8RJE9_9BACT|nr:hypothetical protein [Rhodocytophaga aerolata]MDO1451931.1 hypothetical protein [Rhodocytophaga aerolata]
MKKIKWILIGSAVIVIPLFMAFVSLPKAYFLSKPDCNTKVANMIHGTADFTSTEYQKEVIKLLKSKESDDFRYFFKTFLQEGEMVYMVVNFRNQQQCFDAKMKVDKWDKLGGMRKTNGLSYPEELYEVKWKIEVIKDKQELVYQDMHAIID